MQWTCVVWMRRGSRVSFPRTCHPEVWGSDAEWPKSGTAKQAVLQRLSEGTQTPWLPITPGGEQPDTTEQMNCHIARMLCVFWLASVI